MKNLRDNAKHLAKKGVKPSIFSFFSYESVLAEAQSLLLPRPFADRFLVLFQFASFCTFALLVASAVSEFSFVRDFLGQKIKHETLLLVASGAGVIGIEVLKYFAFKNLFQTYFSLGNRDLLLVFIVWACFMSGLSMYGSVIGGGKLGIDTEKPIAVESKHDSEISQIRTEIADIKKRNTWKGNTYIVGKEKALLHEKEAFLAKIQGQKESDLQAVQSENLEKETTFQWIFGLLEIAFWFASGFVWYYRNRIVVENALQTENESSQGKDEKDESSKDKSSQGKNESSQGKDESSIVIFQGKGVKHCKNCHTPFVANHKIQRFCSDHCRKTNWERIRGKKLRLKKRTRSGNRRQFEAPGYACRNAFGNAYRNAQKRYADQRQKTASKTF